MGGMHFEYVVLPALIVLGGVLIAWACLRRLFSRRATRESTAARIAERLTLGLVAVAAVLAAGSSGVNALLLARARAAIPGQSYLVQGHRMHLLCMGSGSPTLVLDAGLGNNDLIWGGVQPALARTTRVCAFDRPGFGLSEAVPEPHDADHLAARLHGLLQAANISGPVVLMGHSIAGMYIRAYASRYPQRIAGLIFVDGSTPLQNDNPAFRKYMPPGGPPLLRVLMTRALFALGIPRWMGQCSQKLPGFSIEAAKLQDEDFCQMHMDASIAEMRDFQRSGEETVHTGPYGSLPVLIFSQDTALAAAEGEPPEMGAAWNQMQENLKLLSTRSRRIIARGSPHYIQLKRADLLEKDVPPFIQEVRGADPQPDGALPGFGTTTTE